MHEAELEIVIAKDESACYALKVYSHHDPIFEPENTEHITLTSHKSSV
jgi:hypothetical protein